MNLTIYSFWAVFWLDVGNTTVATKRFSEITDILKSKKTSNFRSTNDWLMIIANANDSACDYARYFPSDDRGAILITSRNSHCGETYQTVGWEKLGTLNAKDSVELLLKATGSPTPSQSSEAIKIVKALEFQTLAIIHAGAYISRGHCSISDYLSVLARNARRLVRPVLLGQVHLNDRQVYCALEASIQTLEDSTGIQIQRDALELIQLLSTLHHESMPLTVLQSAWEGARKVQQQHNLNERLLEQMDSWHVSQLPEFLRLPKYDTWEPQRLSLAVDHLESFALVRRHIAVDTPVVSMHPIVHAWTKIRQTPAQKKQALQTTTCVLALATYNDGNNWQSWKDEFGPHILAFLDIDGGLLGQAAQSKYMLQACQQIAWLLRDLELQKYGESFIEDLFDCLGVDAQVPTTEYLPLYRILAKFAMLQDKHKEAVRILEGIQTKGAPRDEFWFSFDLAAAYNGSGHTRKATSILEKAVQDSYFARLSATSRISVHRLLVSAYLDDGHIKEAISSLEEIVLLKGGLPEVDESRLTSQHELAKAYLDDNRVLDAIVLLERVVGIQNRTSNQTHSLRYTSQRMLAAAYIKNGQITKGTRLLDDLDAAG